MSDATYSRAAGAVDALVDGQVVLLSPIDLSYHALDRVGGRVWELLAVPRTAHELVQELTQQFAVSPEQCRADLEPFLTQMMSIGVISEVAE